MAKPVDVSRLPVVLQSSANCSAEFAYAEQIEAGADGGKKLKTFSGVAYTGGAMNVGFGWPVVIDLQGLQSGAEQIAALKDHDHTQIVGHLKADIGARQVKVNGLVSGTGPAAQEVADLSANGFPWQMSVGVAPRKMDFIERGAAEIVNGKRVDGPAYVVRAGDLREVSFVAMGADSKTSGTVAASLQGDGRMSFDQWLEAGGWVASSLTDKQRTQLEATYRAEVAGSAQESVTAPTPTAPTTDPLEDMRVKAAAEAERIAAVSEIAKDAPSILTKAIREGWDKTRTELEVLRASRPAAPAIHTGANSAAVGEDVLRASFQNTLGIRDEKQFKPQVLEASDQLGKIGLRQLLVRAASCNGMPISPGFELNASNLRDVMRFAFRPVNAGFSTVSLPNILENAANKLLLAGYEEVDQSWREIAEIVPLSDFKVSKAYRLLDDMEYAELTAGGEIQHGTVSEETISRSIDTYARMFALTRKQIINDDLSAFSQLPRKLGQGAAKKFNNLFWTAFIDNSSFFTAGRTNYISGSTTTLLTDGVGLGLAIKAFRQMQSPSTDGSKWVGVDTEPRLLLVPPELEGAATALYAANNISNSANGSGNIYFNRFRPVVQPRLSNSAFTGYSATAWYLFGDMMRPMWAGFLNGNQAPTVDQAEADFNTLGIQFRGYHDFGAGQNEYMAGIKSKGAA